MNSANAKTCYVCVSALPSRAAAASAAPSPGRRYASFPDEISSSAENEVDVGAQIARDVLRGLQKAAKPKRSPLPRAVSVPVAEPETEVAVELASTPAAAVAPAEVAPPPPVPAKIPDRAPVHKFNETIVAGPRPRANKFNETIVAGPRPRAVIQETELKAELDWPVMDKEPVAVKEESEEKLQETTSAASPPTEISVPESAPAAEGMASSKPEVAAEEELEGTGVLAAGQLHGEAASSAAAESPPAAIPALAPAAAEVATGNGRAPVAPRWTHVTPTVIASEDWRRELSNRVEAYRARTEPETEKPQNDLAFSGAALDTPPAETIPAEIPAEEPSPRAALRTTARQRAEAVEIVAIQPEFDFAGTESEERPHAPLVPVAEMGERRAAGLLDGAFVTAAYLAFLVVFSSLGGKISFGKMELALFGVTYFLFYVQYFGLFTYFGGITPGMMIRGLRVVGFDGSGPTQPQLLQRTFGYVVSAASLMLGFLWSAWDEDHLTWHDRMSHTYLTNAAPPPDAR